MKTEGLLEKVAFAVLPIAASAIGYLILALGEANTRINLLENKISVVVDGNNRPIPSDGNTLALEQMAREAQDSRAKIREEAALARAELDKRISILEVKVGK